MRVTTLVSKNDGHFPKFLRTLEMTNVTPSRLGVVNKATPSNFATENALFLKVFAGEVLTAFDETNVMKDLHTSRTIASGKSASFPVTGKANAAYHTVGTPLLGTQKIAHNEIVINIDDVLIADTFIANIDEAKNHYAEAVRSVILSLIFVFDPLAIVLLLASTKAIANEPKKPKKKRVARNKEEYTEEAEEEEIDIEQVVEQPTIVETKIKKPKWAKGAIATTKGWISTKGELLKTQKMTEEEVDYFNGK